jgi:transposase
MMPAAYVKPYIRRQKNDASDAAAICEAVTRPSMRFVGVRSLGNQAALMRHKTREMLVSQSTQLLNALRGPLTEVGVIAPQGLRFARELAELIEACDETNPNCRRARPYMIPNQTWAFFCFGRSAKTGAPLPIENKFFAAVFGF